ncbi:transposase [Flavobacterium psychrophilum]|nr:transposase [Flavobacterium psychrophilum]
MTVFNTAANSLNYHLETILNFFKNRHTNANAESFNGSRKKYGEKS